MLPPEVVPVHEDFRLWVLANRPGYPFSGNAFFRECGDAFSSISLDNPDAASEQALLAHVAPTYDAATGGRVLASLTAAFAELRSMAES